MVDHAASASDRNVTSTDCNWVDAGSRSPSANAAAMTRTLPLAIRNAGRIPNTRPSIRNAIAPTHIWNMTELVARERWRDGTRSATSAWNGARCKLIPVCKTIIAPISTAMPNAEENGSNAMPSDDSTSATRTSGKRPLPRALARSDAGPAHGTRMSSRTLSMAITTPMAKRWSPSASRTSGGMKVLSNGPVTPANRPPRPTSKHTR